MKRLLTLAGLALLLGAPAQAEPWSVGIAPSDKPFPAAVVTNDEGHVLYLWSNRMDGLHQIFAELHLSDGGRLAEVMPRYRIDGGMPQDTEVIRQAGDERGVLWGHVSPRAAFWLVWASEQPLIEPDDPVRAWLEGKELEVAYRTEDGAEHLTQFTLEGFADAVAQATGIPAP